MAVIVVVETTLTADALFAPNFTVEPGWKDVPVMVTWVPPVVGPACGLTAVTVGGAGLTTWDRFEGEFEVL